MDATSHDSHQVYRTICVARSNIASNRFFTLMLYVILWHLLCSSLSAWTHLWGILSATHHLKTVKWKLSYCSFGGKWLKAVFYLPAITALLALDLLRVLAPSAPLAFTWANAFYSVYVFDLLATLALLAVSAVVVGSCPETNFSSSQQGPILE